MRLSVVFRSLMIIVALDGVLSSVSTAHDVDDMAMSGMNMPSPLPADTEASRPIRTLNSSETLQVPEATPSAPPAKDASEMNMADADMITGADKMHGDLGSYAMSREASGTSWQPDSTPLTDMHFMADDWMMMAGGYVNGIYDSQGGPRGANAAYSSSMGMIMGQHRLGNQGTLSLRAMMSLDPLMGKSGYPLLFATGETADGRTPLVDRQHPHDLFMELASTYSYRFTEKASTFVYGGLPGEPALGPTTFMHRFSGMDNPEAPITHHWLDSTHITYGVVTGGYVYDQWKLEASSFRGREPDQNRYDIEAPKLDSFSTRLTFNPASNWSMQTSWGYLKSPEQLNPDIDERRLTASATYNKPFDVNNWATTFAWGQKMEDPGPSLSGFLLETSVVLQDTHTFFGRAERVDENELFDGTVLPQNRLVTVSKFSLGYIRDFAVAEHVKLGLGGLISRYQYPQSLDAGYGGNPTSFMIFGRLKLK